jgi:hypothetical protein
MEEDIDWDQVGEMEEDPVREAVFAVVREGEEEAVALIDGVEANVAERERLWLWLNVEDPDSDRVAVEDAVMELLADMETEDDEALEDTSVVGETLELGLEDTSVVGETLELGLEDIVEDTVVL